MSTYDKIRFKKILGLGILLITLFSFVVYLKFQDRKILKVQYNILSGCGHTKTPTSSPRRIDVQIRELMNRINQTVPNVDFACLNETSSAKNSKATIIDHKSTYCVGDNITVRIEMYNDMGEKKTYGGDFLRARIFSPNLGAGVSGTIKDFENGTYNVYFTLFWEGQVKISILLMHPSEGVSVLWKTRNLGYKYIVYTGKFLNKSKEVHTECGFTLDTKGEKCEYVDKKYGESFYCMRPPGVACEAFISLKSGNDPFTYLTDVQKKLFTSANYAAEIPKVIESVKVLYCSNRSRKLSTKCQIGMSPPFPSGYFLKNQWFPAYCNQSTFEAFSHIKTCLAHKMIYLMGDSTLRQWILYFPKVIKRYGCSTIGLACTEFDPNPTQHFWDQLEHWVGEYPMS